MIDPVHRLIMYTAFTAETISTEERGENGFGYDKIFIPENMDKTLAEIGAEEKNKFSHRKRALEDLKNILGDRYDSSSC